MYPPSLPPPPQHMEKISMLAFHPVKMQSCYEKVEQLSLEGLQQRFDVSSPSVFVQRAQILMREVTLYYYYQQLGLVLFPVCLLNCPLCWSTVTAFSIKA